MADKETEGYKRSRQIEREENEADQKAFSLSNLGRKAAGAALAIPSGLAGAALLGPQKGSPGFAQSAKYGARMGYNTITGDEKGKAAATKDYMDAAEAEEKRGKREPQLGKKRGGSIQKYAKGGSISSASSRADGCAQRGKTKGRMI
jgi:hypothetical protein